MKIHLLILISLVSGCSTSNPHRSAEGLRGAVIIETDVTELLENLPDWAHTWEGSPQHHAFTSTDRAAYLNAAQSLATMDLDEVRYDTKLLLQSLPPDEAEVFAANLFVLWRILFDVPATIPWSERKIFGSYAAFSVGDVSVHRADTTYKVLWPVVFGTTGSISSIAAFVSSTGGGYNPLGEFDHFREVYGLRY